MANTGNIFIDVLAQRSFLDVGKDRNITYYFDEGSPAHLWTTFEKAIFRAALQEWGNVANLTFQEVSSPAGADLFETWVTPAFMNQAHGPGLGGVQAGINAFDHFITFGWREGRDPDEFFSTNFYLGANADARAAGVNPLSHYLKAVRPSRTARGARSGKIKQAADQAILGSGGAHG